MSVTLTIAITSPLDDADKDLLAGVAMMTLAIAQRTGSLETPQEVAEEESRPAPCGALDPDNPRKICTGNVGHRGRHRYRTALAQVSTRTN